MHYGLLDCHLGWELIMDSKSQVRELTTSELEAVSGGMVTLDFGIVQFMC